MGEGGGRVRKDQAGGASTGQGGGTCGEGPGGVGGSSTGALCTRFTLVFVICITLNHGLVTSCIIVLVRFVILGYPYIMIDILLHN
jgi:hypothetical protein